MVLFAGLEFSACCKTGLVFMAINSKKLRVRLAEALEWKSLRLLGLIDTLIAILLTLIFVQDSNWWTRFLIFFICSHAIGVSIYFLVCLSDVLEIANLWKRSLLLGGIFVLGGWIGTLLTLGFVMAFLPLEAAWSSLFSWLKNSTIFALLFGALVTGYFVLRHRLEENAARLAEKEIAEQRLLQLKTRAELEALRAKINPHFLFNALNSIASLIPVDAPRAEEMVQRLSGLFRYTLEASNRETVKLSDELHVIREYLEIEKVRLGERLSYQIEMETQLADVPLPGLLLQPLVENSVKHGISPSKNGGQVLIHCRRENDCCWIEISDTGRGFDGAKMAEGFGLSSVRERLALYYGHEYEISIANTNGVQIVIKVPLTTNGRHST